MKCDETLGAAAHEYAAHGWKVFPLRGKAPAIKNPHPEDDPLRRTCKGECGLDGHGVHNATTDIETITRWWTAMPNANIGGRVPAGLIVVDLDPRSGALDDARVQDLPATLTAWSGRGDGGRHLYYRHPGAPITAKNLPRGWDLKTSRGYTVLPPSIHPASGDPYRWEDHPRARMPEWLVMVLHPPLPIPVLRRRSTYTGDSVADWYSTTTSWHEVLLPHGWRCVRGDGDSDGSCWRHPAATHDVSATVRHGCLFVYSPNTPFDETEPGDPHGVTKFRAFAVLDHHGRLSDAARAAADLRKARR